MKKILLAGSVIALLIPASSYAATAAELTAQIQTLLQQVQALQQQVGAGSAAPTTGTTYPGNAVVPARAANLQCPLISRTLRRGSSGVDVTRLQQFLALDPSVYPNPQVTGYYGARTEAAVQKFQCKNKLVCDGTPATTGYGVTGSRTAALLALQCPAVIGGTGGSPSNTVSGFMRVTPTSGPAPLNVQVQAVLNTAHSCAPATYEIYFGDAAQPINVNVPANLCNEQTQTFNHTYAAGGTYSISLRSGLYQNTATVTVSGSATPVTEGFTATPTSGAAPLTVTFKGILNISGACNYGPYKLRYGDGNEDSIPDPGCAAAPFTLTHSYANLGNYVAKLLRGSPLSDVSSVAIAVGGGTGGNFTVTPGANNDPMQATAQFDLASSCTRYDIDWGDGTTHDTQAQGSCSTGATSKSVTHTFQNAGIFAIILKRGANLESSATVGITIVK